MSAERKLVLKVVLTILGLGVAVTGCIGAFRECVEVFSTWACFFIVGT